MVKISSLILLGSSLMPYVTLAAVLTSCKVGHTSSGNTFAIHFKQVADVSESTICGHSNSQIKSAASAYGVKISHAVSCNTAKFGDNQNTMDLSVTFDKQSPQTQEEALIEGITAAFGNQGVYFPSSACGLPSD